MYYPADVAAQFLADYTELEARLVEQISFKYEYLEYLPYSICGIFVVAQGRITFDDAKAIARKVLAEWEAIEDKASAHRVANSLLEEGSATLQQLIDFSSAGNTLGLASFPELYLALLRLAFNKTVTIQVEGEHAKIHSDLKKPGTTMQPASINAWAHFGKPTARICKCRASNIGSDNSGHRGLAD